MTRVKICGITNLEDARAAIGYGADALGFIFVPESSRYVGRSHELADMLMGLPPFVQRVGVFVGTEMIPSELRADLDGAQFYDERFSPWDGKSNILAFRLRDSESIDSLNNIAVGPYPAAFHAANALLLDAYHPSKLGGSGETFNWDLAVEAKVRFGKPIILAGGLTPDNVGEAIAKVRPYAVDVSSGVEAVPGRKDHAKLKAFIRAVRETDRILDT